MADVIKKQNVKKIDFLNFPVYEKGGTFLESLIFGIAIKYILVAGILFFVIKNE